MQMPAGIKYYWDERTPREKKRLVIVVMVVIALVGGSAAYLVKGKRQPAKGLVKVNPMDKGVSILADGDSLERDLYDRLQGDLAKKSKEMEASNRLLTDTIEKLDKYMQSSGSRNDDVLKAYERGKNEQEGKAAPFALPPPPVKTSARGRVIPLNNGGPTEPKTVQIGGIGHIEKEPVINTSTAGSKKKNAIHLPPSFMEATLLSGLAAPTGGDARNNPVPVIIRIKAPAVLPNRVRADLKGCFVIAHGYGSLATERINLRLVNLSCLSRDGRGVIDQKIKGYVVDADGKVGLVGRVVMKAAQMLLRQAIAGFFGGMANAMQQASVTTTTSGLGVQQTIDSDDLGRLALGGGFGDAFKGIQDFYIDLAEQTIPVIEAGPNKQITLVISEGVDLEIMEQPCQEDDEYEECA